MPASRGIAWIQGREQPLPTIIASGIWQSMPEPQQLLRQT